MSPRLQARRWHVTRWADDLYSGGSWSALGPYGTAAHRAQLGQPHGDRFVIASDATNPTQPSMTHGAYEEGCRAARWALERSAGRRVIVIGAGFAGLAAAATLRAAGCEVVVVEARDRCGGRAHSVELGGITVDVGAAWLQQYARNPLARLAEQLELEVRPTDFHAPLGAAPDGPIGDLDASANDLASVLSGCTGSLSELLPAYLASLTPEHRRSAQQVIDLDIDLENGVAHHLLSAAVFDEPGVGGGDAWLPGGYVQLIDHLSDGLDIRLSTPVRSVRWSDSGVDVDGLVGERCICTLPPWLLSSIDLQPGLSATHLDALAHLAVGLVDKVVLQFDERWWPHDTNGYLRWYDNPATWGEWLDLTDGVGVPTVAGLVAREGVVRLHAGRSDAAVAADATAALAAWSAVRTRQSSV